MAPTTPEPLYLPEKEIAARLGCSADAWSRLAERYERLGLPAKDPVMRRRYWPAVRAFFDRHNGLAGMGIDAEAEDKGTENPDALKPKAKRGSGARGHTSA